jgi:hypothetical protein
MNEEEESLAWHALNYRTAHTNNAEEMWQVLKHFVLQRMYEVRELGIQEANRRANAGWALMCRKMVDAERDRCCRAIFGLCLSDNNAQEIVNKIRSGE